MNIIFCTAALAISIFAMMPALTFADAAKETPNSALEAATAATQEWLDLLDKQNYANSWDKSSNLMKSAISKDEWALIMDRTRKPLGTVKSREILDKRTAKNPQGLPEGDYMVMFYKTVFSHKDMAYELVTLYLENGQWRVVTYQVN